MNESQIRKAFGLVLCIVVAVALSGCDDGITRTTYQTSDSPVSDMLHHFAQTMGGATGSSAGNDKSSNTAAPKYADLSKTDLEECYAHTTAPCVDIHTGQIKNTPEGGSVPMLNPENE